MNRLLLGLLLIWGLALGMPLWADDDAREPYGNEAKHPTGNKHNVRPVTLSLYQEECGSCHLAYQPELLGKASWQALMADLAHHFGDDASLEPAAQTQLFAYLQENAADAVGSYYASKLSLDAGKTLLRFSETSYFKREHREVRPEVVARQSIGSWAHCEACHKSADRGVYEEDYIKIPQ